MWQRFTERARRAVFFAQEEAKQLGENNVNTEHLLLGLIREEDSVAAAILSRLGFSLSRIRAEIEKQVVRGSGRASQDMQLERRARRVIDLAYDEARQLNNNYIGTEHLLLGLIREGDGLAGRTLANLGVRLEDARRETATAQEEGKERRNQASAAQAAPTEADKPEATIHVAHPGTYRLVKPKELRPDQITALLSTAQLRGRDLLSILDLSGEDIGLVFSTASLLKSGLGPQAQLDLLPGKTLAMIFEKPSLRTRVTFEAGMTQLGGHAIYLSPADAQIGKRETVADAAKNLARWVDGIMARTFAHQTVLDLAEYASIPVINGLSDLEHPCQALADFYTIKEKKPELEGLKLAFIGDGNNVCNSLMLLSAKLGVHFAVACPEGYEPDECLTARAREIATESGATVDILHDPKDAAKDADALYTDVWASMGQEDEIEERKKIFADYQINQELVKLAKKDVIVLHCLPAHRGEEITDEVLDGPHSVVVDEAENRLHVQKALLVLML